MAPRTWEQYSNEYAPCGVTPGTTHAAQEPVQPMSCVMQPTRSDQRRPCRSIAQSAMMDPGPVTMFHTWESSAGSLD